MSHVLKTKRLGLLLPSSNSTQEPLTNPCSTYGLMIRTGIEPMATPRKIMRIVTVASLQVLSRSGVVPA